MLRGLKDEVVQSIADFLAAGETSCPLIRMTERITWYFE
jgi:hypothetical protein